MASRNSERTDVGTVLGFPLLRLSQLVLESLELLLRFLDAWMVLQPLGVADISLGLHYRDTKRTDGRVRAVEH